MTQSYTYWQLQLWVDFKGLLKPYGKFGEERLASCLFLCLHLIQRHAGK